MNKTTKRVLALMLAVMMLVSALAACGDNAGMIAEVALDRYRGRQHQLQQREHALFRSELGAWREL